MPEYRRVNFVLFVVAIVSFCCTGTAMAKANTPKSQRILVVHSYHENQKNHVCLMKEGIGEVLGVS